MLNRATLPVVLILLSVTTLAIMSNDLYIPSLPYITQYFSTTEELVQLTLSFNALALGLTQIFIGPLSDRFGRKPVLLVGVILMGIFSYLCGVAASIYELLWLRVLQGAAAAVEPVLVLAIFSDLFDEKQRVKLFALYGILLASAPALAPIVGGYIHVQFGWQMNFYLLAALSGFSALLIAIWLKESIHQKTPKLMPTLIASRYWQTLSNKKFIGFTLLSGFGIAFVFAYITAAPFLYIDLYGVAVDEFGYYQAFVIAFYVLGNIVVGKTVDRFGMQSVLFTGLSFMTGGVFVFAAMLHFALVSPYTLTMVIGIVLFGCAPLFSIAPSVALGSVDKELTGSASSLLGGIEMTLAGLVSLLVAILFDGSAYPVLWIMAGAAVFVWGLYLPLRSRYDLAEVEMSH